MLNINETDFHNLHRLLLAKASEHDGFLYLPGVADILEEIGVLGKSCFTVDEIDRAQDWNNNFHYGGASSNYTSDPRYVLYCKVMAECQKRENLCIQVVDALIELKIIKPAHPYSSMARIWLVEPL